MYAPYWRWHSQCSEATRDAASLARVSGFSIEQTHAANWYSAKRKHIGDGPSNTRRPVRFVTSIASGGALFCRLWLTDILSISLNRSVRVAQNSVETSTAVRQSVVSSDNCFEFRSTWLYNMKLISRLRCMLFYVVCCIYVYTIKETKLKMRIIELGNVWCIIIWMMTLFTSQSLRFKMQASLKVSSWKDTKSPRMMGLLITIYGKI